MPDSTSDEVFADDSEDTSAQSSTRDPLDGHISPVICKDGIINNLEGLLNYIASGWKYHVSNTDGVKQAWSKFDNVTNKICSFMTVYPSSALCFTFYDTLLDKNLVVLPVPHSSHSSTMLFSSLSSSGVVFFRIIE
ncbi:unnamed protein product [Nippostrongylus brasiliensis]|uniref:DDE_Tnp_1_7 domain-containing protein n=1 Tax=Nippostrongylus brasiliensis TaxID=27835 RepID=A0A0N4XTJ1_NIPBR|nr:unnamed protein product [Nippostrongylus brasiliensis]